MALEFHRWCHCGRIVVLGLVKRQAAEREIFAMIPFNWKVVLAALSECITVILSIATWHYRTTIDKHWVISMKWQSPS
ncbi:hypothetical protein M5G07_06955 [Serratia symbiotica]|nr:hypothetical protein [Serratia symbiotica]